MGDAHVGQIDVMVAGMIPVANVEAKVLHAAAPVAPQQFNPENSRLFARLRVLSPETRTGVFYWRKARVSKRSYVVKAALGGTDRETELAAYRRRDQPSLKRPLRATVRGLPDSQGSPRGRAGRMCHRQGSHESRR